MKSFAKILIYAKNYKVYAGLNVVFNILSVFFELLSIMLFIPFLNLMFNQETVEVLNKPHFSYTKEYVEAYFNYTVGQMVEGNDKVSALLVVCLLVGVLFFLKNVFRYLALFYISVLRTGVIRDLRKTLHEKTLQLPLSYYSEQRKGDIMSRMTSDVMEVEWSILNSLEMLFREPIAVILSLSVLVIMNPTLTLFSLILLPTSGLLIGQIGKKLKRSSTDVQSKMGVILSSIEETLGGLRIIKAFNAEDHINNKFDDINEDYTQLTLKMSRIRDSASPISEFLGSLVMVALAYFGGTLVLGGGSDFSGGEFFGYIIVFARLLTPVKAFSTAYAIVQKGAASADRIENILKAENSIQDAIKPIPLTSFNSTIEYKNVTFAYGKDPVLKDINISISKGKSIALVGESGGGKSTLADLLPRFYDVSNGEITIDGVNIKDTTLNNLRGLMGIVTQESILFNDTVFNNIAFGLKNIPKNKLWQLQKLQMHISL